LTLFFKFSNFSQFLKQIQKLQQDFNLAQNSPNIDDDNFTIPLFLLQSTTLDRVVIPPELLYGIIKSMSNYDNGNNSDLKNNTIQNMMGQFTPLSLTYLASFVKVMTTYPVNILNMLPQDLNPTNVINVGNYFSTKLTQNCQITQIFSILGILISNIQYRFETLSLPVRLPLGINFNRRIGSDIDIRTQFPVYNMNTTVTRITLIALLSNVISWSKAIIELHKFQPNVNNNKEQNDLKIIFKRLLIFSISKQPFIPTTIITKLAQIVNLFE
jgi:hypothetical protein